MLGSLPLTKDIDIQQHLDQHRHGERDGQVTVASRSTTRAGPRSRPRCLLNSADSICTCSELTRAIDPCGVQIQLTLPLLPRSFSLACLCDWLESVALSRIDICDDRQSRLSDAASPPAPAQTFIALDP